jgi:hypothetical protein
VKYRLITAIALAVGLSMATAIPAGAAKPRVPQVNGDLLLYALVPNSQFGSSFSSSGSYTTGRKLLSTRAKDHVPSMSCGGFEEATRVGVYGDTAGAWDEFDNPNWRSQLPTVVYGVQGVNQFASDAAAMTFYRQALAKYQACTNFTESGNSTDTGAISVSATAVTKTLIGKNLAFQVVQDVAVSASSGTQFYLNKLWVVSGADVYSFWDLSATNDEPWPSLMAELIQRVQRLG